MSQFKKNGTMELETSIGYSFSLIKTEYKQNKIYQNKKKTKRTVNLSFQSALCQQSERQGFHLSSSKGGNHGDVPSYRATVRWIKDHLTHLRSGLNPSEMTACFLDAVIDIGIGNIACFFF